jgi:hypothetical protein
MLEHVFSFQRTWHWFKVLTPFLVADTVWRIFSCLIAAVYHRTPTGKI